MASPDDPRLNGRFKKGKTGNPSGRPRKARQTEASAFEVITDKLLTVEQNGIPRQMTSEEALQHRTLQDAFGGSRMAQRVILKMIIKREKARAAKLNRPRLQATFRTEPEDPRNVDAALQILGIAKQKELGPEWTHERDYLLLEPWAVQAALGRRRGGRRLGENEVAEIRSRTRDADKLRWPRGGDHEW